MILHVVLDIFGGSSPFAIDTFLVVEDVSNEEAIDAACLGWANAYIREEAKSDWDISVKVVDCVDAGWLLNRRKCLMESAAYKLRELERLVDVPSKDMETGDWGVYITEEIKEKENG